MLLRKLAYMFTVVATIPGVAAHSKAHFESLGPFSI